LSARKHTDSGAAGKSGQIHKIPVGTYDRFKQATKHTVCDPLPWLQSGAKLTSGLVADPIDGVGLCGSAMSGADATGHWTAIGRGVNAWHEAALVTVTVPPVDPPTLVRIL
jgi:hypothetical protein